MKRICSLLLAALLCAVCLLPLRALATEDEDTLTLLTEDAELVSAPAGTYVFDQAGLLTQEELEQLNDMAAQVSARYDSGVYVVTVDDYWDYNGESPYEAAKTIYRDWGLGMGTDASGTMLLLSMADRDYAYIATGAFGNFAFTDYGKAQLEREFLDDFSNDDWYGGFYDFIEQSDYYMSCAADGEPIDVEPSEPISTPAALGGSVVLGGAVSCAGAAIRCGGMKKKMKTVYSKADASQYVAGGGEILSGAAAEAAAVTAAGVAAGIILRASTDEFVRTSVTRVPIHVPDNDKGGWGGGTTIDSGGFSGHSGKF